MYASGSHDDSNRLGSPIAHAVIRQRVPVLQPLGFNSGRSLAKYCDRRRDSGFDADNILGLVARGLANLRSRIDWMEDAIVACQGGDAEP